LTRVWLRHGRELGCRFGLDQRSWLVVVVDAGMGAEETAADRGEDGAAARGDAVFGDETSESMIDTLRGLESLGAFEKEFGMVCLGGEGLSEPGVMRAERRCSGSG